MAVRGMFKQNKWVRWILLVVLGVALINAIAAAIYIGYPTFQSRRQFSPERSPLTQRYDLFDLGVADPNQDGFLDIFTLNHSARQNLLISDGDGDFQDTLSQWGLDQDHTFANLEDRDVAPVIDQAGLYIYREDFDLHLRTYLTAGVTGKLSLALPVAVKKQENVTVKVEQGAGESNPATIEFVLEDDSWLTLEGFPEIPHEFELAPTIPLDTVYLGQDRLNPSDSKFELLWRDRHSMAWTDINQDSQLDVFIGRGGIRGKIGELAVELKDELFMGKGFEKGAGFSDAIAQANLTKEGCPARQSAWIDFDQDGHLDLHMSCGRVGDSDKAYPDLLYQQNSDGKFNNVATQVGLDLPKTGHFVWLDADNDGDLDLLASQENQLALYVNQDNRFTAQPISHEFLSNIRKIAIADFDQDSDFDAYVVTGKKGDNKLLINTNGQYDVIAPSEFGLPADGKDATWLDYDNDGRIDLHVAALGIYQQQTSNQFKSTPLLKDHRPIFKTWNALSSWFDVDNDGDRDLLLAYQQTPTVLQPTPALKERLINQIKKYDTAKIWQSALFRNRGNRNHWLTLDLIGDALNASAIGTRVTLKSADIDQVQQVGNSEGSHYSQGHYRLYFGLGPHAQIDELDIIWPDGTKQPMQNIAVDQHLVVRKSMSDSSEKASTGASNNL